jgi:hypothetical protein
MSVDEKAGIPIPGVPDTSEPEVDPTVVGDGDEVDEEAVREARDVEGTPDEETPVADPETPDRPD